MPVPQLVDYLNKHHVSFDVLPHPVAHTAQEVAEAAHVSGYLMAKCIIVKIDNELAMCVVPATERVNFSSLRKTAHSHTAELACEAEFSQAFPQCDAGAMPPFGNLYGMPVFIAANLCHEPFLAFNGGLSTEVVVMASQDFERLVQPKVLLESTWH